MTRTVVRGLSAALLLAAAATPAGAQERDLRAAKERLSRAGTWLGTVSNIDEDKTSFTLEVPISIPFWDLRWVDRNWLRYRSGVHTRVERVTVWLTADTKVRLPHRPRIDAKGYAIPGTPAVDPKDKVALPADEGFAVSGIARSGTILRAERLAIEAWRQQGHAKASATREVVADHATSTVDAAIDVDPGRKAYFAPVEVSGGWPFG